VKEHEGLSIEFLLRGRFIFSKADQCQTWDMYNQCTW